MFDAGHVTKKLYFGSFTQVVVMSEKRPEYCQNDEFLESTGCW